MTIDDIADVENNLTAIDMVERLDAPVRAYNSLRTRMLLRTILNELIHLLLVVRRHLLRHREVERDLQRNTDLTDGDVRIRSDDRAGGELHTLALNVVADAPLLGAETLLDRLERTARALGRGRHAGDLIVHESGDVILEHRVLVLDQILRHVVIDLVLEALVG